MVDKLLKKGYSDEIADAVAKHYKELGYLDDALYAKKYIKDAAEFKYHGPARIRYDLLQKGISENMIDDAFYEADVDFDAVINEIISQKCAGVDMTDRKKRDKLFAYLSRRGFGYYEINNAFNEYIEKENDI